MLEDAVGRLISGALWGIGAGVLITVTRGGGEGLREVTKGAMKTYLNIADRVQEATAEMRENFEDLTAEVRAERSAQADQGLER
jgi:hypothetical protein